MGADADTDRHLDRAREGFPEGSAMLMHSDSSRNEATWTPEEAVRIVEGRGPDPVVLEIRDDRVVKTTGTDLADRIRSVVSALRQAGVVAGDPVAVHAANSVNWIAAGLGCGWMGAVMAPLDVLVPPGEARKTAEAFGATAFLTDHADGTFRGPEIDLAAPMVPGNEAPPGAPANLGPEAAIALFRTSGTTGHPKVFHLTRRNVGFNVAGTCAGGLVGPGDRVLMPLPMHHVYPWIIGTLVPLAAGATVVLPQAMTGPEIAAALRLGEPTVAVGVPKLFDALLYAIKARIGTVGRNVLRRVASFDARTGSRFGPLLFAPVRRRVAPRLRLMVSGGAKLAPDSARALEALGWDVRCGYGLSETAAVFTSEVTRKRSGTEGVPLDGCEIRIEAPNAEGIGEILLRGPNVMHGYLDNPDANARAFDPDGFFRTGDLGRLDDDGFLTVTGRSKEVIVLGGGENLFPEDLETHYAQKKVIAEIAVLEHEGSLVGLVVPNLAETMRRGAVKPDEAVKIALASTARHLPSTQHLSDFRMTHEPLPRTRLGKLRRFLLPELYRKAGSDAADAVQPLTQDERAWLAVEPRLTVWNILVASRKDRPIGLTSHLGLNLGFDSFAWMDLALGIEQQTGVRLEAADIAAIGTVRDLMERVDEKLRTEAPARSDTDDDRLTMAIDRWLAPQTRLERLVGTLSMSLIAVVTRLIARIEIEGRENLPGTGPALLCPNHTSYLDPLVVSTALPFAQHRATTWAADSVIVFGSPVYRRFCRPMRAFPAEKRSPQVTIGLAEAALRRGNFQVWFPEGWRSADGRLLPFQAGIGKLIQETETPVIPVIIEGAMEAWPRDRAVPSLGHRVKVRFGAPIPAAEVLDAAGKDATPRAVAEALHDRMALMLPDAERAETRG